MKPMTIVVDADKLSEETLLALIQHPGTIKAEWGNMLPRGNDWERLSIVLRAEEKARQERAQR